MNRWEPFTDEEVEILEQAMDDYLDRASQNPDPPVEAALQRELWAEVQRRIAKKHGNA